ncbi:hypothetical protein HKD37_01G001164 [Glycine soja]
MFCFWMVYAFFCTSFSLDSNFACIYAFSKAYGDAVTFSPHIVSLKVSLQGVEEHRRVSGMQSIYSTCFKATRISAILIDDGLELDKKHDIEWHRSFTPLFGRILRIERLAEEILDEDWPDGSSWTVDSFTKAFVSNIPTYCSGLEINTNVTKKDVEEGLRQVLIGE